MTTAARDTADADPPAPSVPTTAQTSTLAVPTPARTPLSGLTTRTATPSDFSDRRDVDDGYVAPKMFPNGMNPMLRYCKPYWWPYKTFVKQRWIGRQLLEVISTEFRDRSVDYYRHALESGVTRVNGVTAYPDLILRDGDRIDNTVHRHEPPVSNDPPLVLHIDEEREFVVVSKPGSLPVHAAGRYFKHTLLEILKNDHGIKAYAVNRLDRLTSGLMILALSGPASRDLAEEFKEGKVGKEYIARVRGCFPEEEILVDQPLLTVDRQMGLVIVAPQGKESQTIFKRMSYDAKRDQSVVHCRPLTGRTHQIRVHLQWLGYPIANDPLYAQSSVWGPGCGKGGVDLAEQDPSVSHQLQAIAARVAEGKNPPRQRRQTPPRRGGSPPPVPDDSARLEGKEELPEGGSVRKVDDAVKKQHARDLENIDLTSPIRLSEQARTVISKLRRQRDEAEDWVKWKEVVWATKKVQDDLEAAEAAEAAALPQETSRKGKKRDARPSIPHPRVNTGTKRSKAAEREMFDELKDNPLPPPLHVPEGFCDQCFVPVPDDPDPETLFIYLHARRYTTERLGTWETPLPRWAGEDWDGDWRGWDGQAPVSVVPPEAKIDGKKAEKQEDKVQEQMGDKVQEETASSLPSDLAAKAPEAVHVPLELLAQAEQAKQSHTEA